MKATLYSIKGEKKSQVELPAVFQDKIREDLVLKFVEAQKFADMQPYSHDPRAGRKHSASGTISHKRHDWKGHYGKGISRVARKTMWRRGTQFFWVAAEVSGARGGRRVHGPTLVKRLRKINKKEEEKAVSSALSATAMPELIIQRYATLTKISGVPAVIESLPGKTKELISVLEKIAPEAKELIMKSKTQRAGKGKSRGRRYKSNAGLLIIKSSSEKEKFSGLDVKSVKDIEVSDLYPLGRLTLYTQKAIEELNNPGENKK